MTRKTTTTRKPRAKHVAPVEPTPPVEPVEPEAPVEPTEPKTEAGRMIKAAVDKAIANGAEIIVAQEAEPAWLDNVRRAKASNKCPCGEPATTLVVYGESLERASGANGNCDEHAVQLVMAGRVAHWEALGVSA